MIQKIDTHDIQGLLVRGYAELTYATFLLFRIDDSKRAARYFSELIDCNLITPAEKSQVSCQQRSGNVFTSAMHLAFTSKGLFKLNVSERIMETFCTEFTEGMAQEERSVLLGDVACNAPSGWVWEVVRDNIHGVLMCYAIDQATLNTMVEDHEAAFLQQGISLIQRQSTFPPPEAKREIFTEHFGFRDGIMTPIVEEFSGKKEKFNTQEVSKVGEFVLGYKNEYPAYSQRPTVWPEDDPQHILPFCEDDHSKKDLGRNGTFLVMRQIEQKVVSFWQTMLKHSMERGNTKEMSAITLASKMVGRLPDGTPLCPHEPVVNNKPNLEKFSYSRQDKDGIHCPFSAHIRRTNPRDQIHSERGKKRSTQMVKKHKMIRRGRIFGKPLVGTMKPDDMLKINVEDGKTRGLHFICLVGSIKRQFEFVQNVWINNQKFADLSNDTDPLLSISNTPGKEFTVQDEGLSRTYTNLPQFTKMMGGGYFFLPGLAALRFILGQPFKDSPVDSDSGVLRGEEHLFYEQMVNIFKNSLQKEYGCGRFFRRFHPKSLGLIDAEIEVEPILPENLQVGIFKRPGAHFKAFVRFSNGHKIRRADYKSDIRGMAIKILEVGEKTFEKDFLGQTQDIVLTNNPIAFPGTAKGQLFANRALFGHAFSAVKLVFQITLSSLYHFLANIGSKPSSVLDLKYYSGTPYKFGQDRCIKWKAELLTSETSIPSVSKKSFDYLKDQLQLTLNNTNVTFGLYIQSIEHPTDKQIENSGLEWDTPFTRVATITLLPTVFGEPDRLKLEEKIVFSPWHSIADHEPLGGINRLRRFIYRDLSAMRSKHNKSIDCNTPERSSQG